MLDLTRRRLLIAGAAVPLAACTASKGARPAPVPTDADSLARAAAALAEQEVADAYDEALLAAPALAARISPLREHHVRHVAALVQPSTASPTPAPGSSATIAPVAPATVLRDLARRERALQVRHLAALSPVSAELGLLLASIAAAAAAHTAELIRR